MDHLWDWWDGALHGWVSLNQFRVLKSLQWSSEVLNQGNCLSWVLDSVDVVEVLLASATTQNLSSSIILLMLLLQKGDIQMNILDGWFFVLHVLKSNCTFSSLLVFGLLQNLQIEVTLRFQLSPKLLLSLQFVHSLLSQLIKQLQNCFVVVFHGKTEDCQA